MPTLCKVGHQPPPEQIADMLVGPGFLRMLYAFGLPKTEPPEPDALLDAIWRGVAAPA
jgi:hypothetical protein